MAINLYEVVTQKILDQLEKGVIPWRKTWNGSKPINYITRKPYRGINTLLLPFGGEYLTFKQCKDLGGSIRKGEKANMIIFYKPLEIEKENEEKAKTIPYLQYSNVFHLSQCEGITSKLEPVVIDNSIEPIEQAQRIFDNYILQSSVKVQHIAGSNKACYSPSDDTITLPVVGQFESAESYYNTAFHEAAHSTGHETRLNRISKSAAFGNGDYSREELVAEIAAAMVMSSAGIEQPETFENSVAYIHGWSKKLKEDKKAIVFAAGQAQKAADLILN